MQWSKQGIDADGSDIKAIVFAITLFKPVECLVVITQTHINQGQTVRGGVTLLSILAQFLKNF
jgi:hypothetical protein